MKKYLFILGLVGTALFTACSTSDDLTAEKPPVTPVVDQADEAAMIREAGQNSDVSISLGVGSSRGFTRSPLVPGEGGAFSTEDNRYLGVFCLSTGIQSGVDASTLPTNVQKNNWKDDDTGLLVRMKNVAAKVDNGEVTFLEGDGADPSLVKHCYYPMGNWMKYNFYAYYPRQNETVEFVGLDRPTIEFSKVGTYYYLLEKYFEIDGTQDIIWGKADPTEATAVYPAANAAEPYSARYFRLKTEEVGAGSIVNFYPKLKFEQHKLVQFRFFVKAINSAVANAVTINNIYIPNALGYLSLVIANQDREPVDSMKEGTIKVFGKKNVKKKLNIKWLTGANKDKDRFDKDGNGTLEDPINPIPTTLENYNDPIGYLMLASPTIGESRDPNFKYSLFLDFSSDRTSGFDSSGTLSVDLDTEGGFQEGKIYNIVVTIKSPVEIQAKATLAGWVPVEDPVLLDAN